MIRRPVVSTPCVDICVLSGDFCTGCGRTLDEIAHWGRMTETARREIMAQLPARRATSDLQNQAGVKTQADDRDEAES